MKLTERKLRQIIREEARETEFAVQIQKLRRVLDRHSASEIFQKLEPWELDEIERELNSVLNKLT